MTKSGKLRDAVSGSWSQQIDTAAIFFFFEKVLFEIARFDTETKS